MEPQLKFSIRPHIMPSPEQKLGGKMIPAKTLNWGLMEDLNWDSMGNIRGYSAEAFWCAGNKKKSASSTYSRRTLSSVYIKTISPLCLEKESVYPTYSSRVLSLCREDTLSYV